MIITRTPLRISFVGGDSDLPAFYRREPGAVVSEAIDKYIYIAVNPKFDHKIRASYSRTEIVDSVDELRHERSFVDTFGDEMQQPVDSAAHDIHCDVVISSEIDIARYVRSLDGAVSVLDDLELSVIRERWLLR